jgi:Leucine-rich repeat (LRR) protein
MLHRLVYSFVGLAFVLLCACNGYDVKVNDKVVYSPIPLFSDFTTADPGLQRCLERAINDGVISAPDQLTNLDCSFAGIEQLDGLATFTELKSLRLSANKVSNLGELSKIITLQEVFLDDNQIVDAAPLYPLSALRKVDLSGNAALQCPKSGRFVKSAMVILPQHCS